MISFAPSRRNASPIAWAILHLLATPKTAIRAGYGLLGLITYFTAGEPEVRAWPCERDAPAPVAASKIHTDFEKHFIRAEVTSVDELVAAGSMDALRAKWNPTTATTRR